MISIHACMLALLAELGRRREMAWYGGNYVVFVQRLAESQLLLLFFILS